MFTLTFFLYFIMVLVIALYIYRRDKKVEESASTDFWTGGQKISGLGLGMSISASMMSISWSVVYGSQLFYQYGVGGIWLLGVPWFITIFFFWLMTPWLRKQRIFSQPELLGKVFGDKFRVWSALVLTAVFLTWAAGEIYAAGIVLSPLIKMSPPTAMALISLTIAIYSMLGGFAAVVATDKIQYLLVGLFMILIIIFGLDHLDTDIASLFSRNDHLSTDWFSPGLPLIVLTLFAYLPGWFVETDVWLRIQAAATDREARKGAAIALGNTVVFVILLPMIIGLMAHLWQAPSDSDAVSTMLSAIIENPNVPLFWQIALFLGLISAAMSTIDTCSNIVALSLGSDIFNVTLKKRVNISNITVARVSTLIAIGLAFLFAVYINSLWDIFYLSSGLLSTAVFIPVVLALRNSKNSRAAWFATLTGLFFTILFFFLEQSGMFTEIYPPWLIESKLGYLIWGLGGSVGGFLIGFISGESDENENF